MKKSVESCIFCAPSPCTCNVTPLKKIAPKKTVLKHDEVKQQPPPKAPPVRPAVRPGLTSVKSTQPAREIETEEETSQWANALTVLFKAEIIDWRDVEKHWPSSHLNEREARLLIWKLKVRQYLAMRSR